jgi:integrase
MKTSVPHSGLIPVVGQSVNRRDEQWSREKQKRMLGQLKGFWAKDDWDMKECPLEDLRNDYGRQRRLHFRCHSDAINGELKYACWKKFSEQKWRTTLSIHAVHKLAEWLNTLKQIPPTLVSKSFKTWRTLYQQYLASHGLCSTTPETRIDRDQHLCHYQRDSHFLTALRQIYLVLQDAYDERPEQERDRWDLRRLSVTVNPSLSNHTLNFNLIPQRWLRDAAKTYIRYCLPIYAEGTCRCRLQAVQAFSVYLAKENPRAGRESITRKLLLDYLRYLPTTGITIGLRKNHIVNLRTFLEMSAREGWLPIKSERMIHDGDIPQTTKGVPRYIPSAVLDQLNSRLGNLPGKYMRMILILQECGMRISELLSLPFDCLTQDARGNFYLRYVQTKMRREHIIPISAEAARVIQEQQQAVKRNDAPPQWLFASSKGTVHKQQAFAQRINRLALKHEIRDANGKLFRFHSHQFRHTVATRMINLGVPHHIIQRYLGHSGPEMTNRYAHIHDATMKEKLAEYLGSTLVDIAGKKMCQDKPADSADLQWFTRNVLAQALTNGYCAIPIVAGPCPHPNACLTCTHFRTDKSFIEVHRAELQETDRVLAKAKANGWNRQMEMNERKRTSLINIITGLETNS